MAEIPGRIERRGLMLVLSSPSGAGKTTISRLLLERDQDISLSVSVMTMTSRSTRTSIRSAIYSICVRNCGSNGLSAKTTNGLARQIKLSGSTSEPSKIRPGFSTQASMASCESAEDACRSDPATKANAKNHLINSKIVTGFGSANAKCNDALRIRQIAVIP